MSNYNLAINWAGKDALSDSDPDKVISGDDFNTEFTAVKTAVNTKAELNGSASESFSATTATAGTNTTQVATTAYVQTEVADCLRDGDLLDEDTMSSNSATAPASQQSIKAYVDAQIAANAMSWNYITRATLASTSTLSNNTWSSITIPGSVPATAKAIIISVYLDTDDSSVLTMFLKSSSVSERSIGYSVSDNNSDDSSGSFNTITIPYTSTVDFKFSGSNQRTGYFYLDGYVG